MTSSVLTEETPQAESGGFECNVLVLGMIAKVYGQHSPTTPMRGWGGAERNATIQWDGKSWRAAPNRKNGKPGIRLTVTDTNTGKTLDDAWIPFSELDRMTVNIEVEDF